MTEQHLSAALATGAEQAGRVLAFRQEALALRAQALTVRAKTLADTAAEALARSGSAGVLIAEGDSWFDYPFHDVLQNLEDLHGYDVESVAHKGEAVEEMAYNGGQLEELTRRLEKVLRRGTRPRAILISGGGNDVVGDEFPMMLNHAMSASPGINQQVMRGVVDERVAQAYVVILNAITRVCEVKLGERLPILMHGYDYAVADGRGYLGGWWFLPGPWMEPGFRRKAYSERAQRIEIVRQLIDHLNDMLIRIPALPEFSHVRHVDIRNTLPNNPEDYMDWWDNELHPTPRGFEAVTNRFVATIDQLP